MLDLIFHLKVPHLLQAYLIIPSSLKISMKIAAEILTSTKGQTQENNIYLRKLTS
jgi:hypothetical protein